ncbi:MAG: M48 family metallopeptidase [Betaproteobacteria bacterium]
MTRSIELDYFDGIRAKALAVRGTVQGQQLCLTSPDWSREYPLARVQWPERTQGGSRTAHLPDGSSICTRNAAEWDAWVQLQVPMARPSWVVRAQQSWRGVAAAALLVLVLGLVAYLYGVPWTARALVTLTPASVDKTVGDLALQQVRGRLLQPSHIGEVEQQQIRSAFGQAIQAAFPNGDAPAYALSFQSGKIGANAFALPGGHIVVTDDLVQLSHKAGPDGIPMLVAVFAHEMGHVRLRHGMRMLVQVGILGAVSSTLIGDFSSVLAAIPALLGQADYSRSAEREADTESIRIMRAWGQSPAVMNRFFELARQEHPDTSNNALGIAFASHPADKERMARFSATARKP